MDPEMKNRMEVFVVLQKLSELTGGSANNLCLYNAPFYDENRLPKVMDLIHSNKFSIGNADLDSEIKSWKFIYDLYNI